MNFLKVISVLGITSVLGSSLWADMPSVNPRPRMQMMGGAGLSTTGDKDSAMINPAGLSDIEESEIQVFPLLIQAPFQLDSLTSFLDYNDVRTNDASTNDQKSTALQSFLSDVAAESIGIRVNLNPSYTMKYFHAGLLIEATGSPALRVNDITGNNFMDVQGTNMTFGGILAGSYAFFEETLSVGASLKPLYRYATFTNENVTLYDLMLGQNSNTSINDQLIGDGVLKRGAFAFGVDLGLRYRFKWYGDANASIQKWIDLLKPAVGLTYQDVANTRFFGRTGDVPKDIDQSVSAGISVEPDLWIVKTAFAFDMRNIQEEQSLWNKLHFGAEATLWDMISARVGMSQGYMTGGMGLDVPFFELDLYVTAEEVGESASIQENRTLGFRASFTL